MFCIVHLKLFGSKPHKRYSNMATILTFPQIQSIAHVHSRKTHTVATQTEWNCYLVCRLACKIEIVYGI